MKRLLIKLGIHGKSHSLKIKKNEKIALDSLKLAGE